MENKNSSHLEDCIDQKQSIIGKSRELLEDKSDNYTRIETSYAVIDNANHDTDHPYWSPSSWFAKDKRSTDELSNLGLSFESMATTIVLSNDELSEFIKLDVDIDAYNSFREIRNKSIKVCGLFSDNLIGEGFLKAIEAKATDLLAAFSLKNNKEHEEKPMFEDKEIRRALRDLNFMLDSIYMALGGEIDWEFDNFNPTFCDFLSGRKYKNNGYESSYEVRTVSYFDHGDFDDIIDDEKDNWDLFQYEGTLNIQIDPLSRISFDYIPKQSSANDYHKTETIIQNKKGERLAYNNNGLSLRIDIDKTAPCGIALDVGRSPYDASKSEGAFSRDGDLLGSIFAQVSPNGCHEYSGFTTEMRDKFKPFAEELALNQYLRWSSSR